MSMRKEIFVELPDHMLRWLEMAQRQFSRQLGVRAEMMQPYSDLRPSQHKVLQMIPTDGARITDLAEIAGMTKQALGELVDGLEAAGYSTSVRDDQDRRIRMVTRTPKGEQAVTASVAAIEDVEAMFRRKVGTHRYDEMKATLRELCELGE